MPIDRAELERRARDLMDGWSSGTKPLRELIADALERIQREAELAPSAGSDGGVRATIDLLPSPIKIVTPYARLMDVPDLEAGTALLRKIEWCGRISHRSEDAQTQDGWRRFIETVVLGHGDWSIVEHASATVDMLVDRGITHEIVRHRLFSFTQESTRFVNYEKKMPPSFILPAHLTPEAKEAWMQGIREVEKQYRAMLREGCAPQLARSVFPNALASRIVVTGNLRNWRHFFIMRTTREAHPQMREVTIPLLAEFKAKIPVLYDDIEPLTKQSESMKRMR